MRRSKWCMAVAVCAVLNVAASDDQMRINPVPPAGWTPPQATAAVPQPSVPMPPTVPAWTPPPWTPPAGPPAGIGTPVEIAIPTAPVFGMAYGQVVSKSGEGAQHTVVVNDQQSGDVTLVVQSETSQITRERKPSDWGTLQVGEWVDAVYQLTAPEGQDMWDSQTQVTNIVVYVDVVQPGAPSVPSDESSASSSPVPVPSGS